VDVCAVHSGKERLSEDAEVVADVLRRRVDPARHAGGDGAERLKRWRGARAACVTRAAD
jgi:hypothetical protein